MGIHTVCQSFGAAVDGMLVEPKNGLLALPSNMSIDNNRKYPYWNDIGIAWKHSKISAE